MGLLVTLDSSIHWGSGESLLFNRIDDAALSNLSLGPKITFRHTHVSPFLEVLIGDHRLMPDAFHDVDKIGFMAGGGVDINLSRHIALRLLRADYVFSNYRYGPAASTSATELRGVRLQTGLNFTWGGLVRTWTYPEWHLQAEELARRRRKSPWLGIGRLQRRNCRGSLG